MIRGHRNAIAFALMLAVCAAVSAQPTQATSIEQRQLVFREALRRVSPSIVRIDTIGGAQPSVPDPGAAQHAHQQPGFRVADGPTTGVIWSPDGYILTSNFNFVRDPTIITVTLADGRRFVAKLVARDRPCRLALLKIDAADLPIPQKLPLTEVRPGQWALAAGFGHGSAEPTLSVGIVSAGLRMAGQAVQTDAKTSPANYGGPLFDLEGRVIGICVPMGPGEDELAGVEWYDSGTGFAIHADQIARRFPRLRDGRELRRGFLGLRLDPRDPVLGADEIPNSDEAGQPAANGVRIIGDPIGAAADAGLQSGDVITAIDGEPTVRLLDIQRVVARKAAGDDVSMTVLRDGESQSFTLTLTDAESLTAPPTSPPVPPQHVP